MNLKLIQKVKIDFALKRKNLEGRREWQKNERYKERIGYVIGIRTLSDIEFKNDFDYSCCEGEESLYPEPVDYFPFSTVKRIKAALVVFNLSENPVYVPVSAITIL